MRYSIIAAVGLMIGCSLGVAVRDLVVPARAQGQAGPVYEYHSTRLNNDEIFRDPGGLDSVLNQHGRQGFRLAGVISLGSYTTMLAFERPALVRSPAPAPATP